VPASDVEYTPPGYEEPPPPLPYNRAFTDWPRIIAINVPASVFVLLSLIVVDFSTGFDLTRIAVRYGGPGAPPISVAAFWIASVGVTGVVSTLLTSVVSPEAYVLKSQCPDCGAGAVAPVLTARTFCVRWCWELGRPRFCRVQWELRRCGASESWRWGACSWAACGGCVAPRQGMETIRGGVSTAVSPESS